MAKISQKDTIKGLAVWWVILIIVVVIVVGAVVFSFIFPRQGGKSEEEKTIPDTTTQEVFKKTTVDYEKKPTYALFGKIQGVSENQIIVSATDSEPNPFLMKRDFTVLIDERTKFFLVKSSSGVSILEDDKGATLEIKPRNTTSGIEKKSMEPIEFSAFLLEDYVVLLAYEEIKQKDIFVAKEIYKLQ